MDLLYVESFLTPSEARASFRTLEALPWTRGKFMGRTVPREEIWIGPYAYRFSGRTLEPAAWTAEIAAIRTKIQEEYGGDYNSVLLNRYADERDSVSWHSDGEAEMDSTHPIASVSLGASRVFLIRTTENRGKKRPVRSYALNDGSLLIMPPGFQQTYQHCVPKSATPCGPRINLTFRRMRPTK